MSESKEPIVLNDHERLQIIGVIDYEHHGEKRSRWTRIGTAFQNKDGSLNLRFEYMPVIDATIQIRPIKKHDQNGE